MAFRDRFSSHRQYENAPNDEDGNVQVSAWVQVNKQHNGDIPEHRFLREIPLPQKGQQQT